MGNDTLLIQALNRTRIGEIPVKSNINMPESSLTLINIHFFNTLIDFFCFYRRKQRLKALCSSMPGQFLAARLMMTIVH